MKPFTKECKSFTKAIGGLHANAVVFHMLAVLVWVSGSPAIAQDTREMTLGEVLETARNQSVAAFRAENMFLAGYWKYRAFQAELRPQLNLDMRPVDYSRTMTERYNYDQNVDEYREQQNLNSFANLSMSQNIPFTGGEVFISSNLNRLVNYAGNTSETYSATPVQIGLVQPVFGFNAYKWERRIAPLELKQARQQYLRNMQELQVKAVDLFFNLVQARIRREIAATALANADTIYATAQKRFELASVSKNQLLDLELNRVNAETELIQAEKAYKAANFELNSFLDFKERVRIAPEIPGPPPAEDIELESAVQRAKQNHPAMTDLKRQRLMADKQVDKQQKNRYLNANLVARYGLNQSAPVLDEAYNNLLSQQIAQLAVQIPILDWGKRKGNYQMALKDREVTKAEIQQQKRDFHKQVMLKTLDYNKQRNIVAKRRRADSLSRTSYKLRQKQFLQGNADVLQLTSSQQAWKQARLSYINSLHAYWKYYYQLRELTLFNFKTQTNLNANFETMTE